MGPFVKDILWLFVLMLTYLCIRLMYDIDDCCYYQFYMLYVFLLLCNIISTYAVYNNNILYCICI